MTQTTKTDSRQEIPLRDQRATEKEIQDEIRIALSKKGCITFRNNVGIAKFPDGSVVRYGVCNPGGSDLIGMFPVIITEEMVGKKIAAFLAIEVKAKHGKLSDEQENFIRIVKGTGGVAGAARSATEALEIINAPLG